MDSQKFEHIAFTVVVSLVVLTIFVVGPIALFFGSKNSNEETEPDRAVEDSVKIEWLGGDGRVDVIRFEGKRYLVNLNGGIFPVEDPKE